MIDHCRIWKIDKGAKKLIQLAIEGDKFLARESKAIKKSISVGHKDREIRSV